jgi:hypothetical protein
MGSLPPSWHGSTPKTRRRRRDTAAAADPIRNHPVGARRAYAVPRRGGGGHVIGGGEVVGHRTTGKGPFVEVRDASGELRSVRPNCISEIGAAPEHGPAPQVAAGREPAPVVIQTVRDPLPGWPRGPRGLREDLAAAYVGISSALLRPRVRRRPSTRPG